MELEELTVDAVQIWRNMSSFGARSLADGVSGVYIQATDALRLALEEDLSKALSTVRELRMKVAFEWITHAAKPLLKWAQENIGCTNVTEDDSQGQYVGAGSLYHGTKSMCLQRWGFWMDRFEELGKDEGLSERIRKAAIEAAQILDTIERGVGHRLRVD